MTLLLSGDECPVCGDASKFFTFHRVIHELQLAIDSEHCSGCGYESERYETALTAEEAA